MRIKGYASYPLLIILTLVMGFLALQIPGGRDSWYSLILKDGTKDGVLRESLEKIGSEEFISRNDPVLFSDFSRLVPIPLYLLPDRLMAEDLRFDPYLKKLASLFTPSQGERVFFRSQGNSLSLFLFFLSRGREMVWEQRGSGLLFFAGFLFYLLLGAIHIRHYGKRVFLPLLIQILWIPCLLNSTGTLLVFLPLILFWEIRLIDNIFRIGRAIPEAVALLFSGILVIRAGGPLLFWLELSLTMALGIALALLFRPGERENATDNTPKIKRKRFFRRKTEHQLFEPLFFGAPPRGKERTAQPDHIFVLLITCILAVPLFLPYGGGETSSLVLPGRGEFLDHVYYQENILYGASWGSREPIIVQDYKWDRDTGEIHTSERVVSRFTSDWVGKQEVLYGSGFADSLLLSLPTGTVTLPQIFVFDFDKYMIFAIILLFFLSKLVLSNIKTTGKEKKSLQINKRGREVA